MFKLQWGGGDLARKIDKAIAVFMAALMTSQNLVLWPPCEVRQNEARLSLRAVVPLPRAVGILPESTREFALGDSVHWCRNSDLGNGVKRKIFRLMVNMGYWARDEPARC